MRESMRVCVWVQCTDSVGTAKLNKVKDLYLVQENHQMRIFQQFVGTDCREELERVIYSVGLRIFFQELWGQQETKKKMIRKMQGW